MSGNAAKVRVSERQLEILEEFRRSRSESLWVVKRADIIVSAWYGESPQEIASHVSVNRLAVGCWRWREAWGELTLLECTEPARLREAIRETHQRCPATEMSGDIHCRAGDADFGGGLRAAGEVRSADHAVDQR